MTETLEALRRRIHSVEEMQSVVTTMKVMAAVNIRQYEAAARSLAEYSDTVDMGIQIALRHRPEEIELAGQVLDSPLGLIVFGSDQGMVGQFNQQVADHVDQVLQGDALCDRECVVLAIGRRVAGRLIQPGRRPEAALPVPGSLSGITPIVQDLLVRIEAWRERRGIEQILLFYNAQLHGAAYKPTSLQLLPLDLHWLQELEGRTWPTHGLPTFFLEWDTLFASLVREYFFVSLYRAFAESLASENASRLASMQAAEKNIEDRMEQLHTEYHHLRQSSITEELLDVVAGYETLSEGADN
jgi:F-type H+-transporting ATPase subunit gamma